MNLTVFLIFYVLGYIPLSAFVPKVDQQARYMEVKDIDRRKDCIRVVVTLKNYPGWWNMISSECYLQSVTNPSLKFKVISQENITFDSKINMSESGNHDGVLIFEPIPTNVTLVDFINGDPKERDDIVYGIHLNNPYSSKSLITNDYYSYLYDRYSDERWNGIDPKRYKDIPGYDESGTVHIRGKLNDYTSRCGQTSLSVDTRNWVNGKENVGLLKIREDGTFSGDIPLAYPQFGLIMGVINTEVFLMPGDTLDLVTTTLASFKSGSMRGQAYILVNGKLDKDLNVINVLSDTIHSRYNLGSVYKKYSVNNKSDNLKEEIFKKNRDLCSFLDSVITDLPNFLGTLPISVFAKDMLAAKVVASILEIEESNEITYRMANSSRVISKGNGDFSIEPPYKELDMGELISPRRRYNEIIYDNPIMLGANFILPNRWEYGFLFNASQVAACGKTNAALLAKYDISSKSSYDLLCEIDSDNIRKVGIGNCFAAQIARVKNLIENLDASSELNEETMREKKDLVSNLIPLITYPTLSSALNSAYTDYVSAVVASRNKTTSDPSDIDSTVDTNTLGELITPYMGNVIYIDFWGIDCGPCRSGMLKQKPIIEKFADKPFKVLYVTDNENEDRAKRWMTKEGILGEHIFVTPDKWNNLRSFFNFIGTPYGVLVNVDGKVIKTGFPLEHNIHIVEDLLHIIK